VRRFCFLPFCILLGAQAASLPCGPVPESVPPPPAEPPPESWRFREELSVPMSGDYDVRRLMAGRSPWLTNRISRCLFGPIKRPPHNRDELADDVDYYPDAYLDRFAREGVNGLWLTIEFRDFSQELTGDWPDGASRRIAKLRRTVEKCARHGIKVWLFCIEPVAVDLRRDPLAFRHPDWIGCTYDGRMGTMCASHPEVRTYVENTVRDVFSAVPGLGGIINISDGERVTSCLSIYRIDSHPCRTLCPRCKGVPLHELHHRAVVPMVRGMRSAGSGAELISWIYRHPTPLLQPWVEDAAATVPDGVVLQSNFEDGVFARQEGRWRIGNDYWIAAPGPSMAFVRVAEAARRGGRRIAAKIQTSCSHEIATIPVLPVPGLLYRKFKAMREQGVTDSMLCWYFGSAPGLMNRAAGMLAYDDFAEGEDAFLLKLARLDWGEDAERMVRVWKACADGFSKYPLSNFVQYYGPYHQGVVWPLRPDIEMRPLGRSWVSGQPAAGDMAAECLGDFTIDEALRIASGMCREIDRVGGDIAFLERKYAGDVERMKDLGRVRALQHHFTAGRDFFKFYHARRDAVVGSRMGDLPAARRAICIMKECVTREMELTRRMKELCLADSLLGYHSECEGYSYHPVYLDWRLPTLERSLERLGEIEAEIRSGRDWPFSPLERAAPTFPAHLDGRGDLVLEGEAKGRGTVTLWLFDLCGTRKALRYDVEPKNGRFSAVVPSEDWDGDVRLRPAWIQIHQGCSYLGDSWQWPEHEPFEWRWHHRDLLGFYSARIVVSGQGNVGGGGETPRWRLCF